MVKGMRKSLLLFLSLLLLLSVYTTVAFANTAEQSTVSYVALGDSLAEGLTPDRTLDKGYPDYIVDRLEMAGMSVSYENYGLRGHTSASILNEVETNIKQDSGDRRMQIDLAEADVITLNAGANDLLGVMTVTEAGISVDSSELMLTVAKIKENTRKLIEIIKQLNPDGNMYVMGYYNPFPDLPDEQTQPLLHVVNSAIEQEADAAGISFVPTAATIAEDPSLYLPNRADIHPSLEGYQAIANEFWKMIQLPLPVWKEPFSEKVVTTKKAWTVRFSAAVEHETTSNIVVTDAKQRAVSVVVDVDDKSVTVTPSDSYQRGESYSLYIPSTVESVSGEPLTNQIKFDFTIKDDHTFTLLEETDITEEQRRRMEKVKQSKGLHHLGGHVYMIAAGEKMHLGYGINYVKTETSLEQVKVYVQLTEPKPEQAYGQQVNYPYLLGKVDLPGQTTLTAVDADTGEILE